MSWQFNHLIGQQTTDRSASSSAPSDSATSMLGAKPSPGQEKLSGSCVPMSSSSETSGVGSNFGYQMSDMKNVDNRMMISASSQPEPQQAMPSFFVEESSPGLGSDVDGHGLFQKFLHQQPLQAGDESQRQLHLHQLHHQHHQNLSPTINNSSTILGTPLSPNGASSFDYLLANQQPPAANLPWSSYSMPVYSSSFGQVNICAPNQQRHGTSINNILLSESKLHPGTTNDNDDDDRANIIDRFNNNQRDNNKSNVFSHELRSSNFQTPQSQLINNSRSYSNVLHAAGSDTTASQQESTRFDSVFGSQHQLVNTNNQDLNNNEHSLKLKQQHPSLLPTNKPYSMSQQRNLFNQSNYHYAFQGASSSSEPTDPSNLPQAPADLLANQNRSSSSQQQTSTGSHSNNRLNNYNHNTNSRKFPSMLNNPSTASSSQSLKGNGDNQRHLYGSQSIIGSYGNSSGPGGNLMIANSSSGSHSSDILGGGDANAEEKNHDDGERFSRKVFVGGLPPDIDEEEIKASFRRFGSLVVDWPHKAESKSYFPPKGYAFLLFHEESSVQALIESCLQEEDKLYLCVSSPTIKDKPVQIRPWRLSDADFVLDATLALDPRKTVFVGGVPRPLKASELANIMNNLYGGVSYAGIDTDPELKYPKGAGRVAFSNHQSYIAAISARFVHLKHSEFEKRVEVKPYVLDDQFCDECQGSRCKNKFAPFFCANIACLQYYCETCWSTIHSQAGKEYHKPLMKEGADRPRGALSSRWS